MKSEDMLKVKRRKRTTFVAAFHTPWHKRKTSVCGYLGCTNYNGFLLSDTDGKPLVFLCHRHTFEMLDEF